MNDLSREATETINMDGQRIVNEGVTNKWRKSVVDKSDYRRSIHLQHTLDSEIGKRES